MHEQTLTDERLPLTEVAKLVPGRPSVNCIWRWCRRGVLARNGERIRLEHIRIGGKIFTTRAWLEEFGRRLASEDAKYFDLNQALAPADRRVSTRGRPASPVTDRRRREIEDAERELDQAGLR